MSVFLDFIFDNAYEVESSKAEERVREKYPLMLHEDESIELAFTERGGKGRDKNYFTSHRILIKDGKGIGSRRKNYLSIPYSSIQVFSVRTADKFDGDVELLIWSSGVPYTKLEFSPKHVDIWQLKQFLNGKLAAMIAAEDPKLRKSIVAKAPDMNKRQSSTEGIDAWYGNNPIHVDHEVADRVLKSQMPVLLGNEQIELVCKMKQNYVLFTNYRLLTIDKKHKAGSRIEFRTVLWKSIKCYSLLTERKNFGLNAGVFLFTNCLEFERIELNFRQTKTNLLGIVNILSSHVLKGNYAFPLDPIEDQGKEYTADEADFPWFKDKGQNWINIKQVNNLYREAIPLLADGELAEMAFKGSKGLVIFTNYRLVFIDPKALISGARIQYTSLPWKSIIAYSSGSSGRLIDTDAEIGFYTELACLPGSAGKGEKVPDTPAEPYVSYFKMPFDGDVTQPSFVLDYLRRRLVTRTGFGQRISMDGVPILDLHGDSPYEKLLSIAGKSRGEIDPTELTRELHRVTRTLVQSEQVLMAFHAGKKMKGVSKDSIFAFTNVRVVAIDIAALTHGKIVMKSLPYKSIRAWYVETDGEWDEDTELCLITRNRWHMANFEIDFKDSICDVARINHFFSSLIVGLSSDKKEWDKKDFNLGYEEEAKIEAGKAGSASEIDAKGIEEKFRCDPCLLLPEEKVMRAFQSAGEVDIYTSRRMIQIITEGVSGSRVRYKSLPWIHLDGFEYETNGRRDPDAEMYLYFDMTNLESQGPPRICNSVKTKQSLLVQDIDIYEIGKFFIDASLFDVDRTLYAKIPEVFPLEDDEPEPAPYQSPPVTPSEKKKKKVKASKDEKKKIKSKGDDGDDKKKKKKKEVHDVDAGSKSPKKHKDKEKKKKKKKKIKDDQ